MRRTRTSRKAAIALGIGRQNVVHVPMRRRIRMRADALRACIAADIEDGLRPLAIVATVGTTSTTSVDPVREIAAVAREHGIWLHVDAAYAGTAAIVPEFRSLLDGVELADSLVVNPHKWMFVPMDLSVLFVKDESDRAPRLQLGARVPLGARSRCGQLHGLRLAAGTALSGAQALVRAAPLRRRRYPAAVTRSHRARARVRVRGSAPNPTGRCSRRIRSRSSAFATHRAGSTKPTLERLNASIMHAVNAGGEIFISHTKIDGRYAIRLAIGNLRTQRGDVEWAWRVLRATADSETLHPSL